MAFPFLPILGALGGLFGGGGKSTSIGLDLSDPSALENLLSGTGGQPGALQSQFQSLSDLVASGPGREDIQAGVESQRGLAALLAEMQETGGLPQQEDIQSGEAIARRLFGGQRTALEQQFEQQSIQASRQAAIAGRGGADPILQAKLAQEQSRQAALLEAQQGSAAQQLALSLPGQRLGFAGQRADVLTGLGQRALQNRLTLTQLGQSLLGQEREFRVRTATKNIQEGGGLGQALSGAISGGIAGFGAMQSAQFRNQALDLGKQNLALQKQALNQSQPASPSPFSLVPGPAATNYGVTGSPAATYFGNRAYGGVSEAFSAYGNSPFTAQPSPINTPLGFSSTMALGGR